MMSKFFLCIFAATALCAGGKNPAGGIVDFSTCLNDSKYGKQEQENFESLRKQITEVMQNTEKQLKEISKKLEDADYMDGLSPKAEEELKIKRDSLVQDMNRYQNHFYQSLNQANYEIHQKMQSNVSKASEKIAKKNKLAFIINKDSCFYFDPEMEITSQILKEMDKNFDLENATANKEAKKTAKK